MSLVVRPVQKKTNVVSKKSDLITQVKKESPSKDVISVRVKKNGKTGGKKKQKRINRIHVLRPLKDYKINYKGNNLSTVVGIDISALYAMIEAEMSEYAANSAVFAQVSPFNLFTYLLSCAFIHLRRVGDLSGSQAQFVPTPIQGNQYVVPPGLAKYLQYLGVYKKMGVALRSSYLFNTDITSSSDSYGQNGSQNNDRTGLVPWTFMPQVSFPSSNGFSVAFPLTDSTGSLVANLQNFSLLSSISALLSQITPTVQIGNIPVRAPDASAYARPRIRSFIAGYSTTPPTSFLCPVYKYDPEVAVLFSLSQSATGLSRTQEQAIPTPKTSVWPSNPTYSNCPYYLQPYSVLTFLGRKQDYYHKGAALKFKFGGTALKSLFPITTPITGYPFFIACGLVWRQYMATKQASTTNVDPLQTSFTNFLTICAMVLQRRLSFTEAIHWNQPTFHDNGAQSWFGPQNTYTSDSWAQVQLPMLVSAAIDKLGCIIIDGILRTPAVDYSVSFISTNGTTDPTTVPGPLSWSALGWGLDGVKLVDDNWTHPNLYSTPFGMNQNSTAPPNIPYAYGGNIITSTYVEDFCGHVGSIFYPLTINGTAQNTIIESFDDFNLQGNAVTQTPLVPVEFPDAGSKIMANTVSYNNANVATSALNLYNTTNPVVITEIEPESIAAASQLTSEDLFMTTLLGVSELFDPQTNGSSPTAVLTSKWNVLGGSAPVLPDLNTVSQFLVNFGTGASWNVVLNRVARATMDPNSQFNQSVRKILDECVTVLEKKDAQPKTPLAKYFKQFVKPFAEQAFSTSRHQIPDETGGSKTAKMMDPIMRKNVDAATSQLRIKGYDSPSGVKTGSPDNVSWKNLLGQGKSRLWVNKRNRETIKNIGGEVVKYAPVAIKIARMFM